MALPALQGALRSRRNRASGRPTDAREVPGAGHARTKSAVHAPLLLAAAGLLDPSEGAQWREHRLTQAWWQPTVETLRLAEPAPAGPFAQMLAHTDARTRELPAVLAADGGERPRHLPFAPVAQAVAHSSTGYIQPLVQDLILEAFGGLVLARGVDARADELRSPAARAAAEPHPPLPPPRAEEAPEEEGTPEEAEDEEVAEQAEEAAGWEKAPATTEGTRAATTARVEREALDGSDLQAALRQRVATLRSAPALLRGWKLLVLIPTMLLSKGPSARTVPKEQLLERFARFEELAQRCERAHALAQQGKVSAARQALTASTIAPGTEAAMAELRDPARRLAEPREPLRADLAAWAPEPILLGPDQLLRNLLGCRRGAAPGPSSMTGAHMQSLLEDEQACGLLHHAATRMAQARLPGPVAEALRLGQLTAPTKPNGRARGNVTGDVLRIVILESNDKAAAVNFLLIGKKEITLPY
ncbi:unnamed protein product [Prorocentrum cordatum]|uniref:Uncharacterized protein n=1 Tax=Prorocentrum cordatum TaxID=2364126 RepID=A0ABN9RMS7_9DINO|nr:unnamed protein product [Polarella glacialis]